MVPQAAGKSKPSLTEWADRFREFSPDLIDIARKFEWNVAMRVLVIIPAFNEEASLPMVAADLGDRCRDAVVVDDGSQDGTSRVARDLGLTVIRLPFNLGIGGAVQTGFKYAREEGYDAAIQFDGDNQHRADQIPQILAPIERGEYDLVIGSRHRAGGYSFPFFRRIGGLWFSWLLGRLSGLDITDPTSGFRGYGPRALDFFSQTYPDDFPEVESTLLAAKKGLRITEVPSLMRPRHGGESSICGLLTPYYMVKVSLSLMITWMKQV